VAEDIYALCDALVDETAALSPVAATMLGIAGYDHLWDDFSTEGCEEQRRAAEDQLARVRVAEVGDDPWAALAAEVAAAAILHSPGDDDIIMGHADWNC